MATTVEQIRYWLSNAIENGCSHMLVVCDTFDHEDFPVNVKQAKDVTSAIEHYNNEGKCY